MLSILWETPNSPRLSPKRPHTLGQIQIPNHSGLLLDYIVAQILQNSCNKKLHFTDWSYPVLFKTQKLKKLTKLNFGMFYLSRFNIQTQHSSSRPCRGGFDPEQENLETKQTGLASNHSRSRRILENWNVLETCLFNVRELC